MRILITLLLAALAACSSTRSSIEELQKQHPNAVEGVITAEYSDQGCPYLFKYTDEDGNEAMVRPVQLPDELKVDGLKVLMETQPSKMHNEGCDVANPASIVWYEIIK